MAKVAIVILNWNGQKMLAKYLPNVIEYSRQDAEIWVADNSSSDGSMHLLETQFPQVKTIVLEQNFGFAEGYNRCGGFASLAYTAHRVYGFASAGGCLPA